MPDIYGLTDYLPYIILYLQIQSISADKRDYLQIYHNISIYCSDLSAYIIIIMSNLLECLGSSCLKFGCSTFYVCRVPIALELGESCRQCNGTLRIQVNQTQMREHMGHPVFV